MKLGIEVTKTAKREDVATRRREKFTIESNITLPFPSDFKEGWEDGSLIFPDLVEDVEGYIKPSSKAMKQGKSLMTSGHVSL